MIFGITIEKLMMIGLIAAIIVGPDRLPRYAATLAHATVRARELIRGAKDRVRSEMGEDFPDVDWRTLDPRQYDPRRIIREALSDVTTVASPYQPASMKEESVKLGESSRTLATERANDGSQRL